MNSEERQLISSLFDRMQGMGAVEKDRDAEALINQSVRQVPDAAYMLVQSVLVQEHALQQAGQRIEELESRVRQLEQQPAAAPQAAGGGSFLGGLFGGGQPARPAAAARGSVPSVGGGSPMGAPTGRPSAWGNAPGYGNQQQAPAAAAGGGGGGFMRYALTTAAGVAGGMRLTHSIAGMMKGDTAQASESSSAAANNDTSASQASDAGYADEDNDPGTYDASDDDGGDWGSDI